MNKGFTLTELIVYVALLAIIVAAVVQIVFVVLEANVRSGAREEVLASALQAVESIRKEVREAQAVYVPTSTFSSHPGQLSVVSERNAPSGELVTYVDFFLSDEGQVCINREEGAHECVTSPRVSVTDLRFVHLNPEDGPEAVQTFLTLEHRSSRAELRAPYAVQSTDIIRDF